MLQPSPTNKTFHARTRAKAKMFEYAVPLDQHIDTEGISLSEMLDLTIGMLGDLTAGSLSNLEEEKYRLLFSAQYFNSIIEAQVIGHSHILLRLLSSSAYYLSGYPGSSQVLLRGITEEQIHELTQMEQILFFVLCRKVIPNTLEGGLLGEDVTNLVREWNSFLEGESSYDILEDLSKKLRSRIYQNGTDKDLLLIDIVKSLVLKRFNVSARNILSEYSDVDMNLWESYFTKRNHIEEFWPSQVKLAEYGVFRGLSAVVQMPTSAGKTRATEFIVRSSFLSNRTKVAIIVAPFRALCQEIYNDFRKNFIQDHDVDISLVSDVLQDDYRFFGEDQKTVLILTPEKLDFMLRHDDSLSELIGLIVYDEGHLFDDETRGTKYELLLSSLKRQLSPDTQVVLISAVITNAQEVKEWLVDQEGVLVDGADLSPTNRSIAFVDWTERNRSIQFVDENDINQGLFFVPYVLRSYPIERRGREREKFFPKPRPRGRGYEPSHIAGFLGARLASSGLSAVFVGQKKSAQKIANDLIDAYGRNLPIERPIAFSENSDEANKVIAYIESVLGPDSVNLEAARLGILMHHTGIPHGLRLVTEYALQNSHFKTVVCTSTLAQGVNLPIRYLIISPSHQAGEKIKTRDFHNLMGRAGRSGKYTEGTVIFSNPDIYRSRARRGDYWTDTANLLNSENSEPSMSRMSILLSPRPEELDEQVKWDNNNISIRKEITSYLLNALYEVEDIREMEQIVTDLVQNTLGYSQLETQEQRTLLTGIFLEIGFNIMTEVPDTDRRLVYSRSILNLEQSQNFVSDIEDNLGQILTALETGEFSNSLDMFWSYLYRYSNNKILRSFSEADAKVLCQQWIGGISFSSILEIASGLPRGEGARELNMLNIIDLCEAGFSYDISTLLGSLFELVTVVLPEEYISLIKDDCYELQKRLKYGTPGKVESMICELGFSDRALSIEIEALLEGDDIYLMEKNQLKGLIRDTPAILNTIQNNYPGYFVDRFNTL